MAKWQRMPESNGLFFFVTDLKDRDISTLHGVQRIEYGCGKTFLTTNHEESGKIDDTMGWWLKINDERMTAEVEA